MTSFYLQLAAGWMQSATDWRALGRLDQAALSLKRAKSCRMKAQWENQRCLLRSN